MTSITPRNTVPRITAILVLLTLTPLLVFTLTAKKVYAERRYVKPVSEIVVRSGQGREYKIIGVAKSGSQVELLEETENYALVRLQNNKEGWMLKRYLSTDIPFEKRIETLSAENAKLKEKQSKIFEENQTTSTTLRDTKKQLTSVIAERDEIQADFLALQKDTADVVKIKNELITLTDESKTLTEKLTSLEDENDSLKKEKAINWFLAGGGVLLLGFLIGKIPSPSRKRKSSLLR